MVKKVRRYMSIRFDRIHERDRQTDGRTGGIGRAYSIARQYKPL